MRHDILLTYDRKPLKGYTPEAFVEKLTSMLRGRAAAVYIFSSFTTSRFSSNSDVDLFIVTDIEIPFIERPLLYGDLLDAFPSLDILVYTPAEFKELTTDPSPGFWSSAVDDMRRIA